MILQFGQLFLGHLRIGIVGHDVYVLHRNYLFKPVESALQQGSSCSEKIEKLFGFIFLTKWPEAASHTTTHYYAIIITVSHYEDYICLLK